MTSRGAFAASMRAGMPKAPTWWCLIPTWPAYSQIMRRSTKHCERLHRLFRYRSDGEEKQTNSFRPAAAMSGIDANAESLDLAAMDECRCLPAKGFVMQETTTALPGRFSQDQSLDRTGASVAWVYYNYVSVQSMLLLPVNIRLPDSEKSARKIRGLLLLILLSISGCTSSIMTIRPNETRAVSPIGLFVIASRQLLDNEDSAHKAFVTETASATLPKLFQDKGFEMKSMSSTLKVEEVFSKHFMSFYIDEYKIAEVGKNHGFSSVLIVYFAYAGNIGPLGTGLNSYSMCSLYGWLVHTKDSSVISSSHTRLNSFDKFLQVSSNEIKSMAPVEVYRTFFKHLLVEMFGTIQRPQPLNAEKAATN